MQNTYYIIVRTDKGDLSINQNFDALKIEGFTQEIDFTFRKELTDLPVKKSRLLVDHKIRIDKLDSNITPGLVNQTLEFFNIYKAMCCLSSIRTKIHDMLLEEEFLKNNVLRINQQEAGTEYERKILKLYKPQKYQDELRSSITLKNLKMKMDRFRMQSGDGGAAADSSENLFAGPQ